MADMYSAHVTNTRSDGPAREHCAICRRQRAAAVVFAPRVGDGQDISTDPARWLLCTTCAEEVWREVERANLDTPARIPVAVALVASARSPHARPSLWSAAYWEEMDSATQDKWMIRAIIFFCIWPMVLWVSAVVLTAVLHP